MGSSHAEFVAAIEKEKAAIKQKNDSRLMRGTMNRMVRVKLSMGWNTWVGKYHQQRFSEGLENQSSAHHSQLEEERDRHTKALETV